MARRPACRRRRRLTAPASDRRHLKRSVLCRGRHGALAAKTGEQHGASAAPSLLPPHARSPLAATALPQQGQPRATDSLPVHSPTCGEWGDVFSVSDQTRNTTTTTQRRRSDEFTVFTAILQYYSKCAAPMRLNICYRCWCSVPAAVWLPHHKVAVAAARRPSSPPAIHECGCRRVALSDARQVRPARW